MKKHPDQPLSRRARTIPAWWWRSPDRDESGPRTGPVNIKQIVRTKMESPYQIPPREQRPAPPPPPPNEIRHDSMWPVFWLIGSLAAFFMITGLGVYLWLKVVQFVIACT